MSFHRVSFADDGDGDDDADLYSAFNAARLHIQIHKNDRKDKSVMSFGAHHKTMERVSVSGCISLSF